MFELPTSITIDDKPFKIRNNGDYRMVLDCFRALNDCELDDNYRILACLIIFYDDIKSESDIFRLFGNNLEEPIKKMFEFFNCGQPNVGASSKKPLINWDTDTQLIAGAVNDVAKTEVRELSYLHWWTFMGYYLSIGEGTFSTIIGIRHKIVSHKKLEKYEQDFKRDNPQYFVWNSKTSTDVEVDEWIKNVWNGGGEKM